MLADAGAAHPSAVRVQLSDLIRLKSAGESIKLTTPRIRAFAVGGHLSPFKGRGVEFDESRPYQAGDDLRTMDWRVTARTGKPYTKVFREERNRPVVVWLDLRQSMMFATRGSFKAVFAAEAAAVIAWSAVANGDQLGGLVLSEAEHSELRPRLGRRAALRLLSLIAENPAWEYRGRPAGGEDLELSLLRLTRVVRPGSMLFMISDFLDLNDAAERYIRQLASHGDIHLVHISDPVEAELPPPGRYRIQMGGRSFAIDTGDARLRDAHRRRFALRMERVRSLGRLAGINLIECTTLDSPHTELSRRFARA